MIKVINGDITLDGDSDELIIEATSVVLRVVEALVEENCLSPRDIPDLLDSINSELHRQTKPLVTKNNKKYN